jgi:hypothetical protein
MPGRQQARRSAGRAFEVVVAVEIAADDRRTVEEFEAAIVGPGAPGRAGAP